MVAWVTLGKQHLPQTEHLPNTVTVGGQLSFFVQPFNYFDEDPSMRSNDAVRIVPKDKSNPLDGAIVERYTGEARETCLPELSLPDEMLAKNSSSVFT